jgi:hypothetical protein
MWKTMYCVWVGGVEVNDDYLTEKQAEALAETYKEDGYEDVVIQEVDVKIEETSEYWD